MKFKFNDDQALQVKFAFTDSEKEYAEFFKGESGEILPVLCQNLIFLGLGDKDKVDYLSLRLAANKLGKYIADKDCKALTLNLKESPEIDKDEYILALVEGLFLSSYNFDFYKTKKCDFNLETVNINSNTNNLDQVEELVNVLEAQVIARDLVNKRSNDIYPETLANYTKEELEKLGVKVKVYNKEEIEKMNLKAFMEVAKGSDKEPRFIVMEYLNGGDEKPLVLVGKGLTYDAGGYSLKPSNGMKTMNSDMGGSATVIGAMAAIAKNQLKTNVVAIVAACENLVSGRAYKPGDVISSLAGKTIEVDNTDAEGRLTLADAVCYGSTEYQPRLLIDLATLTGACLVALGERFSGVITNSEESFADLQEAADKAYEKIWMLPNDDAFKELNKSKVADIKNSGGRFGGTITAGQFVGEFVKEGTNWIHMDIAGTAYLSGSYDCFDEGATGVHVKTLYNLAKKYSK